MTIGSLFMVPYRAAPQRILAAPSPRFAGKMTPADYEYLRLYQADLDIARKIQPALNEGSCQTLVEAWRDASSAATKEACRTKLIYGFMPLVVNIARPRAGEGVELSDLIQKGNDKIVELLPSSDAPPTAGNFYRFATRAVSNVYRDCFRVEHLPQRRHAVSTADVVVKSTALPAEKLAQSNEGIERLEHAIGQLSEDDQKIIRAVMAGPCSGDELAEILGVQASAAHMRKSRAIRRLAAILNPPSNDAQEDESEDSSGIAHLKKAKAKQPRKKATTTTACMTVEAPRAVLFHPEDVVQLPEPESTPGHAEEPIVLPLAPVALRPRPLRADWTGVFLSILG